MAPIFDYEKSLFPISMTERQKYADIKQKITRQNQNWYKGKLIFEYCSNKGFRWFLK